MVILDGLLEKELISNMHSRILCDVCDIVCSASSVFIAFYNMMYAVCSVVMLWLNFDVLLFLSVGRWSLVVSVCLCGGKLYYTALVLSVVLHKFFKILSFWNVTDIVVWKFVYFLSKIYCIF